MGTAAIQKLQEFRAEAKVICLPAGIPPEHIQFLDRVRKAEVLSRVEAIPQARHIYDSLVGTSMPYLFMSDRSCCLSWDAGSAFPVPQARVSFELPGRHDDNFIVGALLHEGRHLMQLQDGLFLTHNFLSPQDRCWLSRVEEADAQATAIDIAFQDNDKAIQEFARLTPNMCEAFAKSARESSDNVHNGIAKRAAFDAWFVEKGGRLKNGYDLDELWYYPTLENKSFPSLSLTASFLQKFGTLPGDGVNYLALPGCKPLDDAYYKGGFSVDNQAKLSKLATVYPLTPGTKR